MRRVTIALGLAALLLVAGCKNFPKWPGPRDQGVGPQPAQPPSQEILLQSINQNAQRLQTVESRIDIQADAAGQSIGLSGNMSAQQPLNFRMMAKALGQPAVDMGSNSQEFWYWVKNPGEPMPLIHCAYEDLATGKARMNLPFQPEWIIETLGMKERDPQGKYEVAVHQQTIDLIEETISPQGKPVRKVTVFNRTPAANGTYQVVAHHLMGTNGEKEPICSAYIKDVHYDQQSRALLPKRIVLSWPAERMKLDMVLDRPSVNPQIDPNRAGLLFVRPNMPRAIDLAKMQAQPMSYVQQTGGYGPPVRR